MCISKELESREKSKGISGVTGGRRCEGPSRVTEGDSQWAAVKWQNFDDKGTGIWLEGGFKEFVFLPWRDSNWERAGADPHCWDVRKGTGERVTGAAEPAQIKSLKGVNRHFQSLSRESSVSLRGAENAFTFIRTKPLLQTRDPKQSTPSRQPRLCFLADTSNQRGICIGSSGALISGYCPHPRLASSLPLLCFSQEEKSFHQ